MKKGCKLLVILLSVLLITVFLPGCGGGGDDGGEFVIPDEIQELMDVSVELAIDSAKQLDGAWGDMHVAMMESGEEDGYADFETMRAKLVELIEATGADYIYAMYPSDADDLEADFFITVDGSEDADDFGTMYEAELGMVMSWQRGIAKTTTYAWGDDNGFHWSAFAPIHNSDGDVVAVLGLDYPAPYVENHPEWDYDSDDWNEFEWE